MKQYRQGDIYIQEIHDIPVGVKKASDGIILRGESSGHAHRIIGGELLKKGEAMFLNVLKKAQIVHEEHKTIDLPHGKYGVVRQREYLSKDMTKVVVD